MDRILDIIEEKVVPVASKIGSQRHLVAIRDGLASLMPLIMAGSITLLLNNVVFSQNGLIAEVFSLQESAFFEFSAKYISPVLGIVDVGTLSLLGLAASISIAYTRATNEGHDGLVTAAITAGSFVILGALSRDNNIVAGWVKHYLGSQGMFIAMIVGLVAPAIYFFFVNRNLTIKMPDSVPEAVSRGFAGIIPGTLTLLFFAAIRVGISEINFPGIEEMFNPESPVTVFMLSEYYISKPFSTLSQGLPMIILVSTLVPLFWFFGLHGANIMTPIMSPMYGVLQNHNLQAFEQGIRTVSGDPIGNNTLAYWVSGSWDAYVYHGGSGATLPLILAIVLFSKRKDQKEIAKMSLAPGLFMINEPILFGLPIVLNPVYFIPFVINQPILATIGYLSSKAGFAGPIVNTVPWTTPPILNALLATNFSIGAALTAAFGLVVSFIIYVPFVYAANHVNVD